MNNKISLTLKQREKIALILGWRKWQDEYGDGWIWTPPNKHHMNFTQGLPDFTIIVKNE